ncbi:NifU family protein [Avrilella dinanensis]|uniref:NifU family protein n=1 Tax=Avrilella dinanensis TaxID=2008672 RepID=UPI00240A80DD|nr:NifU family protein [Avrilella dinanensis]
MTTSENIRSNVEKALDEIRPFLISDGGDINLIAIEDDKKVIVELIGNCSSCNVNQMTLRVGVETTIKKYAPEIETVENISSLNPIHKTDNIH